ncbi:MAG: hypothetical protein AAGA65_09085 [Actinomycetota bacterium]
MLGWELLPFQQYKLDVAFEHDGHGNLFYDLVVEKAPRRSGKTTQNLSVILHRMQQWQDQTATYTAQTLNDARKKWRNEHCKRIKKVRGFRERRDYVIRNVNGDESIEFPRTGGRYAISATGEKSGHGDELHLYVCDEAFAHEDLRVDQSFLPTMDTVVNPQQWVTSAAGKWKGVYLIDKVDKAKAAVEADTGSGTCGFIWEADPDCDRGSPDVWRTVHPTLGSLLTMERMQNRFQQMDSDEFARAYLGITTPDPRSSTRVLEIPLAVWAQQADEASRIESQAMVGVAMPPDRSHTSVGVAGRRLEGDWHVQHAHRGPGSGWVVEEVGKMVRNIDAVRGVAVDPAGPASSLGSGFEAAGIEVFELGTRKYGQACGLLKDGLKARRVWHRGQDELSTAVGLAEAKHYGDMWIWKRADGDESIADLEAVTLALGAAESAGELTASGPSGVIERGGLFRWD